MKRENFTKKIFFRLWVPELISAFGLAFADMADALVLGHRMQATGLAAISLCLPIFMVINVFMNSFGLGGSTFYSRYMGEGRTEDARRAFNDTLLPALFIGIVLAILGNLFIDPVMRVLGAAPEDAELYFSAKEYARILIAGTPFVFLNYILNYFLRNDNKQKIAAIGFTVANVFDLVMNMVFVLVLDMGAAGAALSTVLGQVLACIIYMIALIGKDSQLHFKPARPQLRQSFRYFKNGASLSVQYVFQFVFILLMNNVLMSFTGEDGVAVFELIQNASFLVLYVFDASAKAMQPLLSTYCGECNEQELKKAGRLGECIGIISGGILIVYILLFPQHICLLFGLMGESIIPLAKAALRIYCIGAVFAGFSTILENYYQSCDMERSVFVLTTLRGAAVLLPMTLVFALIGADYIWYLYPATELLSLLLFSVWRRLRGEELHIAHRRKFIYDIHNTSEEISGLSETICDACADWGIPTKAQFFSGMAAEEICLAIKEHNKDSSTPVFIQITLVARSDDTIELHLRDNGLSFNPFALNSGKLTDDDFDEAAMGILVIKKRAKEFLYRQYQGFNTLVVKV